ncbi:L,D-transpeptidase/peptidoglycan binding protein [Actinomyces sp. B33]|uniref:L,D-transpeptidase family protein n=1 Tax=Actinomyces sp. B33 TaxID=2942131 RepID=UPI002340E5FF|nr:L,D-transpeptidase family protein [Actinomyces sp. B33]MDC4233534.1 L,D-transpeptidase/peptidoglycan binding protein [Actinomyces sp. B33]
MRKRAIWGVCAAAAVLVGVGGSGAAYCAHYEDLALPGTSVAGQSVAGMAREEIAASVSQRAQGARLTARVDGRERDLALADLGVVVDAEATADAVLAANASILSRLSALGSSTDVPVSFSVDEGARARAADELARLAGPAVVEPGVAPAPDGASFTTTPGEPGTALVDGALDGAIDEVLAALAPIEADLGVEEASPTITDEQARAAASAANALIAPQVSVTDGIDSYEASAADKVAWIDVPVEAGGLGSPVVDPDAVGQWVKATAEATDVAPVPTITNVDAAGAALVEARPGVRGLTTNNVDEVRDGIVAALGSGVDYRGDFDYDEVAPPTQTRPALAGYEAYVYPAAEGEKWVDIDLGASTLTAYEGHTVVRGPVGINHGGVGHETVTGTYHVYLKYEKQDMGCTPDWPYCAKDVPWVSYFTGSYAMHGAPWVGRFGIGSDASSHGCINMPVDEARWMHDWDEIGTAVVIHY